MRTRLCILAALVVLPAASCHGPDPTAGLPTLHLVKGTVTRGGQPVNGGFLTFQPDKDIPGAAVVAEVGADGRFEVMTTNTNTRDGRRAKGAPAASYRVTYAASGTEQGATLPVEAPKPIRVEPKENEITIELPAARK
jgi:hypothetical protein